MKERLNFSKLSGLIPAIIQDYKTKEVLMLGFMNEEAYKKTIEEKVVTFFSRTRKTLWTKGETSGNFLKVRETISDCDNDTVLILAEPTGPTCHNGNRSCFNPQKEIFDLNYLQKVIDTRKKEMPKDSYTTTLFEKGINKIAQKVGEEAIELIIESKDENSDLFLNESADLVYHLLVLLSAKGLEIKDVIQVLKQRHKT
ncbi:MAG: bifunctional phosphoribosyl-AMP cyclohydrolase/phosphoribosyl-ATP diphosphatase [Bacteroidetes bacterium GWF2_33_16]|nr:MAG: bifunctional phosphoribosyl-AMP cyclohydrolase/phosphoribosyl-ATP diphosphatase [Bacteroidetes bacterium GWE2_32_14]OFY02972.1 MAG: bifunctional phosphoribosyl-AMP cyclohydrolase/phosphoribosyl-ATP diphosphatase [Bacteroidetes bacterium GWF2_33_16]